MHAGLMPELLEDLRRLGLTLADLEPFYRSARGVVELWRTARDREVPGDRTGCAGSRAAPSTCCAFDERATRRET